MRGRKQHVAWIAVPLLVGLLAALAGCVPEAQVEITDERSRRELLHHLHLTELAADPSGIRRFTEVDAHASWIPIPAPGSWHDYYLAVEPGGHGLAVAYWASHEMAGDSSYHSDPSYPAWWPRSGLTRIAIVDIRRYETASANHQPVRVFSDSANRMLYFHTAYGH